MIELSERDRLAEAILLAVLAGGGEGNAAGAYMLADQMLKERDCAPSDDEILRDLQGYFPEAKTIHDCYKAIEALEVRAIGNGAMTIND